MEFVEKIAEAYTQTLQAGMLGIALAVILIALGLIAIVILMITDSRRREDRRAEEHKSQVTFNQGLTTTLNQVAASIASVPDVISLFRSSLETGQQKVANELSQLPSVTAEKIIAVQQPTFDAALKDHKTILGEIDDTKSKIKAVAESQVAMQTTLISKLDSLPESVKSAIQNDIASIASKINGIEEALMSAKSTLALIYGKVTETPVTQVPPLPVLPEPPAPPTTEATPA